MRRAARAVVLSVVLATAAELIPACGSRFTSDAGAGGAAAAAGGKAGAAGSSMHAGGNLGAVAGATADGGAPDGSAGAAAGDGDGGEPGGGSGGQAGSGSGGDSGGCLLELLTDGGFDGQSFAWTESAQPLRSLVVHQSLDALVAEDVAPVSPEYLLWLAGVDSDMSSISQEILVPEAAVALVVSGQLHIHTDESFDQIWDSLSLELTTASHEPAPFAAFSNLDANGDWAQFSFRIDAAPYQGSSATFRMSSDSDDNTVTSFFIDSTSIVAELCDN